MQDRASEGSLASRNDRTGARSPKNHAGGGGVGRRMKRLLPRWDLDIEARQAQSAQATNRKPPPSEPAKGRRAGYMSNPGVTPKETTSPGSRTDAALAGGAGGPVQPCRPARKMEEAVSRLQRSVVADRVATML